MAAGGGLSRMPAFQLIINQTSSENRQAFRRRLIYVCSELMSLWQI